MLIISDFLYYNNGFLFRPSDSAGQILAAPLVNLPSRKRCERHTVHTHIFSLHSRWFFVYFLLSFLRRHHRHCIISSISVTSPTQCNSFISHGSFQPRQTLAFEPAPVLIVINLFQPTTAHSECVHVCACALPGTASITRRCPTRWT